MKVSVITCVFNDERYIESSVRSILQQTHTNLEYIIVDDGSTDSTLSILQKIREEDDRIQLVSQPNGGPAAARNTALSLATGDYIAIQDSDDLSLPERLEIQLRSIGDYDVISSYYNIIDEDGNIMCTNLKDNDIVKNLSLGSNPLAHGTLLIRRSALLSINGYDQFYRASQDFDMYLRLIEVGCSFARVKSVLCQYRIRKKSIGGTISEEYFKRAYDNYLTRKRGGVSAKTPISSTKLVNKYHHEDRMALAIFWTEEYGKYLKYLIKNFNTIHLFHHLKYITFSMLPKPIKPQAKKMIFKLSKNAYQFLR
ncbi:glycosyltransferase family 2 protein [Fibrella arboris]|uniref:glycosyltransferase family 2 protein n=1 Tax=Fibrella arboris TaxID=3242486 RepID=UPI0035212338